MIKWRCEVTDETRPGPGRPRDPQVQDAILRAAHDLLADEGYARMTIGKVAAGAGVGKPTVYRRWPDKHALATEALRYAFERRQTEVGALDLACASAREVVTHAVQRLFGRSDDGSGVRIVAKVMAEADQNPALLDTLRTEALQPRRELFIRTLRELQSRGALNADIDLETVADLCLGGYLAAYLMTGPDNLDDDRARASRLVNGLWPYLSRAADT